MKNVLTLSALALVFGLAAPAAFGHPGKTDKDGCHKEAKTKKSHCHVKKGDKSCSAVGNKKSKIFHLAGSGYLKKNGIKKENRQCFKSEAAAKKAGYRKAKK